MFFFSFITNLYIKKNIKTAIIVPKVLCIISSNSKKPLLSNNCNTSIDDDNNIPKVIVIIDLRLQGNSNINNIPIGIKRTIFQITSGISSTFPLAIALYDQNRTK